MEYEVVYNAVESYQQVKKTTLTLASIMLLPTMYIAIKEWRRLITEASLFQENDGWLRTNQHKIMASSIVFMYIAVVSMFLGHANSNIERSKQHLETQNYEIAVGTLVTIPSTFAKNGKAFTVNNTRFEYFVNGAVNPGQFDNDCKDTECLIQNYDDVKIHYYSDTQGANKILKVFRKR